MEDLSSGLGDHCRYAESPGLFMSNPIFISYSSDDEAAAKQIATALAEVNVSYFLDRKDIKWGDDFTQRIKNGLSQCCAVLVIISRASLQSNWVQFEIGHALGLGKPILPYLTDGSLELPAYIRNLNYESQLSAVQESVREFLASIPTDHSAVSTPDIDELSEALSRASAFGQQIVNLEGAGSPDEMQKSADSFLLCVAEANNVIQKHAVFLRQFDSVLLYADCNNAFVEVANSRGDKAIDSTFIERMKDASNHLLQSINAVVLDLAPHRTA